MDVFRAAMIIAVIFIGAIAALLGAVVLGVGLSTGSVTIAYGPDAIETISRAADPNRFWRAMLLFGLLPFAGGGIASYLAFRRVRG